MGAALGLLVMGALCGLMVQSQAKKKQKAELGMIGLVACIVSSFIGSAMGLYWILSLVTMIVFMVIINTQK
jgi:hypothetical protein